MESILYFIFMALDNTNTSPLAPELEAVYHNIFNFAGVLYLKIETLSDFLKLNLNLIKIFLNQGKQSLL